MNRIFKSVNNEFLNPIVELKSGVIKTRLCKRNPWKPVYWVKLERFSDYELAPPKGHALFLN